MKRPTTQAAAEAAVHEVASRDGLRITKLQGQLSGALFWLMLHDADRATFTTAPDPDGETLSFTIDRNRGRRRRRARRGT